MMILSESLQRTEQWYEDRIGKITASKVRDIIEKKAARDTYKWKLIAERITGVQSYYFINAAMQWGIDNEDDARAFYEVRYDTQVQQAPFIIHPMYDFTGASPDGLVGDNGLVEFKCMETVNHLRAIHDRKVPEYYVWQCQWQMACTDREWCDLAIYDPRVPPELQMRKFRIMRDDDLITSMTEEIIKFNNEIEQAILTIKE